MTALSQPKSSYLFNSQDSTSVPQALQEQMEHFVPQTWSFPSSLLQNTWLPNTKVLFFHVLCVGDKTD